MYPFPLEEEKLSLIYPNLTELAGDPLMEVCIDTRKHFVPIHKEDQARLKPGNELNDPLMDFWMLR